MSALYKDLWVPQHACTLGKVQLHGAWRRRVEIPLQIRGEESMVHVGRLRQSHVCMRFLLRGVGHRCGRGASQLPVLMERYKET